MKFVALIGCGAIGSVIARSIDEGIVRARLTLLYDLDSEKCRKLASTLRNQKPRIVSDIREILDDTEASIVVEAASQEAVLAYAKPILEAGKKLLVLSTGALLRDEMRSLLETYRGRIVFPSGALAGLDAVRALRLVGIERIELISRKPASALAESIKDSDKRLQSEKVVFEGPAEEAVRRFPRSMNVAAALRLESNAPVHVKLLADPNAERIVHEVKIYSRASTVSVKVENVPHPENLKTSYLAALSAVATLKSLCEGV